MNQMDKLRCFLKEVIREAISKEDIKWWTDNYNNQSFNTPEEAQTFIFQQKEYARKQGWGGSAKENRKFATEFPIQKVGSKYKIGIQTQSKRPNWNSVQIKPNNQEELATDGFLNTFDGEKLSKIKMVPVTQLMTTEQHSKTPEGQSKIKLIASSLKKDPNPFFVPVVIEPDGSIVDGHHRYEAVKLLKLKEIPVQVILGRE